MILNENEKHFWNDWTELHNCKGMDWQLFETSMLRDILFFCLN